jgi:hypothetical protein
MSGEVALEGILTFVIAFLAFLGLLLFLRHREAMLKYRERQLAIEKGIVVPPTESRPSKFPRVYLLRGLQWLFVGLSISLVLLSMSAANRRPQSMSSKITEAQWLKVRGASEDQINQYMKSAGDEMEGMPYAAASIGLVPMSVGLAYLIFYRKETQASQEKEAK